MIPEKKYYKPLSRRIIGFAKFTILQILTHLITKFAELEDETVQDIYRKTKEPFSGETLFEELVEQIECNQEAVDVHNTYKPAQIVSMVYANIENAGYIKMIVGNGLKNQGLRKPGVTSRLTLLERSRKPE